jgi:DNA-binding MarR family transcriptional regulator
LTFVSTETTIVSVETRTDRNQAISGIEAHLGFWLRRVSNNVSSSFVRSLKDRQASAAEWVLLRELYGRGEATPKDMAETLAMTRGAVSKIVDKLEAKGWIAVRSAPSDGRVQVLSLTQSGRRFVPVLARIADQNDERFFRCLAASERDVLGKLLVKLAECNQIRDIPVQ